MNPSNYEQPGLSLPEPLGSGVPATIPAEKLPVASPEASPSHAIQVAPSTVPSVASLPVPAMPVAPAQPTGTPATTATPSLADDSDLIEKEWVTKAKAIVEHTKDDPHEQSKEMNYFKADYLKKRYNKDVKVSES